MRVGEKERSGEAVVLATEGLRHEHAGRGGRPGRVIACPDLRVRAGEELGLVGASGAGKSTVLNALAGIVRPTAGRVLCGGVDLTALPEAGRDRLRARTIGYVFQAFNLLQGLSALENVRLAAGLGGQTPREGEARARALLERVGLADRLAARPRDLSVGEQQRVAIARALVNRPSVVLADEPTASLDAAAAGVVLALLREAVRDERAALILATHDETVRAGLDRVVELEGGVS